MTPEQQATIAEIERLARDFKAHIQSIGSSYQLDYARKAIETAVLWAKAGVEALGGE